MDKTFLPFEIIINILKRLPMKSVVRFQCVCKDWKNLFKTKSFISQHTLHSAHEDPFLLIHAFDYNYRRPTLRLLNQKMELAEVLNTHLIDSFRRGWRIAGSSNGLLCIELQTEERRFPISYLLWNPLINEVREVPQILYDCSRASTVGFGYSGVVDDYKIVRFYHPELLSNNETKFMAADRVHCVQVYSLNNGSWKELEIGNLRDALIFPQAVTANGTIFWKGLESFFQMLISFDIAKEVFTVTPIDTFSTYVDREEYGFCPAGMYEYGNKLAMCDTINFVRDDSESREISMWVIEEGASEFGKSYSCNEKYRFGPILHGLDPLCIWRNEIVCRYERSEAAVKGDEKNNLYLFNLTAKEWKKFPSFSGAYGCCAIFSYEKSLSVCLQHLS